MWLTAFPVQRSASAVVLLALGITGHAALAVSARLPAPSCRDYGEAKWREAKWRDPYIGEWSNGRGDRLAITSSTIRFGRDKSIPYRDLTRVTNGREFNLQVITETKLNYLTEF